MLPEREELQQLALRVRARDVAMLGEAREREGVRAEADGTEKAWPDRGTGWGKDVDGAAVHRNAFGALEQRLRQARECLAGAVVALDELEAIRREQAT